jgi:beta-lactamase regulating signal transducer with metallopeptidase domain
MSRLAFADLLLRDPAALLIIKATVILALASGAAAALNGFSAARRHMLWLVALASCVWLALSSPVMPAIMIHTPMLAQNVVMTAAPPTVVASPRSSSATAAGSPRVRDRFANTQGVRRVSLPSIPLPSHPLIALWIVGCVVLLIRHAIGFVGAMRLARRASIDGNPTRELADAAAAVGVRRHVRLGYSADVQTPITFGVAKPFILLPTEARSWSIERRRAVLVHEIAHIARGDWLSQALGRLACELFWFHPLAWRAFGRLRDDAERAADDCVLHSGMTACEYATHLLELARRTSDARPDLVAVGIVSANRLERRFVSMFDTRRSRATVTSRARAITTSVALAMVCPLASLRVAAPSLPHDAALPHTSIPLATNRASGKTLTSNASRLSHSASARAPDVRPVNLQPLTRGTVPPPIAVVDNSTPSRVASVHPDFSGKWRQDTVASPTTDFAVTDSTIITQSEKAISFLSRGHTPHAVTRNWVQGITFDGAESGGMAVTGNGMVFIVANAVWMADTLVITTRLQAGGHDFHSLERLTLSSDGQTLYSTSSSFVDGNRRWFGPQAFVLRRMTP